MQTKKSKQLFHIVVEFKNGVTRTVKIRAVTREVAEKKARRNHPNSIGVRRDA